MRSARPRATPRNALARPHDVHRVPIRWEVTPTGRTQIAYLGLGANLGRREQTLRRAAERLDRPPLRARRMASLYETEPMGVTDQPRFLNSVLEVETEADPWALLARCKVVEAELGRVARARWGPREIDVDVLLYAPWVVRTPALTVPHPRMHERGFVLEPLAELIPEGVDPLSGARIAQLAQRLRDGEKVKPSKRS